MLQDMSEPEGSDAARRMTVVTSEEELRSWKVAAALRGVSLSEWVRTVLSATAQATMRKGSE